MYLALQLGWGAAITSFNNVTERIAAHGGFHPAEHLVLAGTAGDNGTTLPCPDRTVAWGAGTTNNTSHHQTIFKRDPSEFNS